MLELLDFPTGDCALKWFNTCDYTWPQLAVNVVGNFFWLIAYYSVIRNFLRTKFIEIPIYVACANIAWEFVWSLIFYPHLGLLYWIGFALAFLMDIYIFSMALKYGWKQLVDQGLRKYLPLILVLNVISWTFLCYYFRSSGLDTNFGATSGYIINFLLSTLYVLMVLRLKDVSVLSYLTAFSKGIGTGIITISMFMIYPENPFILALGILVLILDITYFIILYRRKALLRVESS